MRWRSLAPLVLPLGPLRLSLQSLSPRVLLHVGFSPLSFVGSFLWGIAICCASVPGMLCGVSPAVDSDEVRITFESGAFMTVHANLVRISKADTSDKVSEEEFTQFILKVKDDPSYRISFRGSIVDMVGSTEHSNVLCAVFTDHTGSHSQRLPAKALSVKNIALNSNSSGANVNSSGISKVNNVNNVNKTSSSSSTVGDGIVNVSRNSSRSVVPTAALLAAELLQRTTPTSVVGVPKCRKKL